MPGPGEKIIEKSEPAASTSPQSLAASQIYTVTCEPAIRDLYQDPLIGQTLENKYLVEGVIGWGGMSVVYRARQLLIDRTVAIKTIKFRADERPDLWQRFQREIKTLSRLSHPNIVSVYDCLLSSNAQPFVVMDFIKGVGLDALLLEETRLSLDQVRIIGCQVAAGVEHAHRHDVIHRDIKCANIMIVPGAGADAECAIKVVDFGLAKFGDDDQKLTQTGQLWGSPPYISPEQIKGLPVDHRSDIYSLAVVVYEMATGVDPFHSEVIYEMLHGHLHTAPPLFADVCPELRAPALEAVLQKGMAKEPEERFQSMAEFRLALQRACLADEAALASSEDGAINGPPVNGGALLTARVKAALPVSLNGPRLSGSQKSASQNNQLSQTAKMSGSVGAPPRSTLLTAVFVILLGALMVCLAEGVRTRFVAGQVPRSATSATFAATTGVQAQIGGEAPAGDEVSGRHGRPLNSHIHHHHLLIVPTSVKKNLPKPSKLTVDQSKFEVLRGLRSSSLRKDVGD